MEALILLSIVMAIFGVVGYLRGTKSALFTAAMIWLALVMVSRFNGSIATIVNGLNYAVRFIMAGGLQALGGDSRSGALDRVFAELGNVSPLITGNGANPGLALIFVLLAGLGLLLGALKLFRSRASILGLVLGLANGYVISAYLLVALLPEAGLRLPLPAGLLGRTGRSTTALLPGTSSLVGSATDKVTDLLTALADQGRIALVIAVLIALFVLVAVRRGNRSAKKG